MILMKKLTSLLIGCSLTLAGAALAQQPVEQQSPSKGKRTPEKTHATQAQPGANAAKPQERPTKQTGAMKERGAANEPGAEKGKKTHAGHESANAPEANLPAKTTGETPNEPGAGKGRKTRAQEESANAPETRTDVSGRAAEMPTHRGKQQAEERKQGVRQPATEAGAAPPAGQQNKRAIGMGAVKKPDP